MSPTRPAVGQDKTLRLLSAAAGMAVATFLAFHYVYTELNVDSGWYTYPGYALAQGGDPAENKLPFEAAPDVERLVGLFAHPTKNSLRIFPVAAWFSAFEPSFTSAKALGVLEMALAWSLFALCASRLSTSRVAVGCICLLFVLDSTILDAGINDLRPDVFLAVLGLAGLYFLHRYFTQPRAPSYAAALLFCVLIALTHPTGVVTLAVLLVYASLRGVCDTARRTPSRLGLLAALWIVTIGVFLANRPILDTLIPSTVEWHTNVSARILQVYSASPLELVRKDYWRWSAYLLWTNVHLLVLYGAMAVGVVSLAVSGIGRLLRERPLTIAAAVGVVALFVLDPHPARSHAITVTPFLTLAALEWVHGTASRYQPQLKALAALGCVLVAAPALASFIQAQQSNRETNFELQARLRDVFADPADGSVIRKVAFGPVDLWPYIGRRANLLILDFLTRDMSRLVKRLDDVDYLILNDRYRQSGFREQLERAAPHVEWTPVALPEDQRRRSSDSVAILTKRAESHPTAGARGM